MPRQSSGGAKRRAPRASQNGPGPGITPEALNEVVGNFVQALGENGSCNDTLLSDMGRLFFTSMLNFTRILQKHANSNTPDKDSVPATEPVHAANTTLEQNTNQSRSLNKLVKRNVGTTRQPRSTSVTSLNVTDTDVLVAGSGQQQQPPPQVQAPAQARQRRTRTRSQRQQKTQGASSSNINKNIAGGGSVECAKLVSQETFYNAPTPCINLNMVQAASNYNDGSTPCAKALATTQAQHKLNLDIFNFVDQCTNSGAILAPVVKAITAGTTTSMEQCGQEKIETSASIMASPSASSDGVPELLKTTTQLDCGSDVDFGFWTNSDVAVDFLRAAFAGDFQALSSCHVNVSYTDVVGRTALHYACAAGSADCVSYLVSLGSDVNLADKKGWTALHIATSKNVPLVAKILIDAGADIDAVLKHRCAPSRLVDVYSPCIHFAAIKGSMEITTWLIDVGADVNHRDSAGMTPIHYAAFRDNPEYIRFLIANGARLNVKDVNGRGPFHSVALCGSVAVAKVLVEHCRFTNDADHWALTPIKLSQIRGHAKLEEFFQATLNSSSEDANGREMDGINNADGDVNDLSMVLSSTIAVALEEPNIDQIYRCVVRIGPDICKTIFDLTMQIQRNGGVKTCDNRRRRSSGGIFFTFVKELYLNDIISKDDYNYIRAAENEKRSARANERRIALRSKLPHAIKL